VSVLIIKIATTMKDLCTYYANIVDVGTLDISYTYIPEHKMQSYDEATVASCVEIDTIMFKGVNVTYLVDHLSTDFVNDLEIEICEHHEDTI
jgi:hypothetical protein